VREKQESSIQNYNGSKNKMFKEGDEVMIKYYKPGHQGVRNRGYEQRSRKC